MDFKQLAKELRKKVFLTAYQGGGGHLASAFSLAEIVSVLYYSDVLNYDFDNPTDPLRDRVILSKGHGALALYSALNTKDVISDEDLSTFSKSDSCLAGLANANPELGIEFTGGSLGHGLSFGVGVALGHKLNDTGSHTYVILGDGECEEGSVWEGVMSAVNYKLDNLTVILDYNKLQAMDKIENIMGIQEFTNKFKAFGFNVIEIDGHNPDEVYDALKAEVDGPKAIVAHTVKGKGVSFMESVPIWHYRMPNDEELKILMKELGIDEQELLKYEKCLHGNVI